MIIYNWCNLLPSLHNFNMMSHTNYIKFNLYKIHLHINQHINLIIGINPHHMKDNYYFSYLNMLNMSYDNPNTTINFCHKINKVLYIHTHHPLSQLVEEYNLSINHLMNHNINHKCNDNYNIFNSHHINALNIHLHSFHIHQSKLKTICNLSNLFCYHYYKWDMMHHMVNMYQYLLMKLFNPKFFRFKLNSMHNHSMWRIGYKIFSCWPLDHIPIWIHSILNLNILLIIFILMF